MVIVVYSQALDMKLIVELDGGQHAEQREQDGRRSLFLHSLGYRVLRFWNHEVLREPDAVLESTDFTRPHPNPPPLGEGIKINDLPLV